MFTIPTADDLVTFIKDFTGSTNTNEIKKCIPLCRNCHTDFHYQEKQTGITINEYLKKQEQTQSNRENHENRRVPPAVAPEGDGLVNLMSLAK